MKYIYFLVIPLFLLSTSKIELSLYKPSNIYSIINSPNTTIEDLEHTHFTIDLKGGSPMKSLPLEIKMNSDEILILNDNNKSKKTPILSDKTSNTFQIVKDVKKSKKPAIDKFIIDKINFDLKFKSLDEMESENINRKSSGIVGFSLGDIDSKKENKFVEQLYQNKLVSNSIFYFDFKEPKLSKNQIISLEDYLNLKGKLTIGEYPNNISKKDKKTKNKYTIKTSQVLQKLKIQPNADPILYDDSSYSILLNFNKCVGCTLCAQACATISGQNILECERHQKSHTKSGKLLADTPCISCGQCSLACPMSAITEHFNKDEVTEVLKNKQGKIVVCQIAPAVRINMAEALGVDVGTISTGKIVTALKMLGFDYIFDTTFGADMTIVEEATEFVKRFYDPEAVLPMFTSCCPAWVNYIEKSRPDLIPHLSSCRSPLSMLSSVIKNIFPKKIGVNKEDIYNVGIMPCTAKKDEIKRPQLNNETDAIITSRELATMIQDAGIDFANLEETELDTIYSKHTGGGALFCATGGVMESALRSAFKFITGKDMVPIKLNAVRGYENKIKTASIDINGVRINVAVAHGIINAMELIEKIENKEEGFDNIHFVEVMGCPGGCVIGGGSPKARTNTNIEKRLNATYSIDKKAEKKCAQDNEQLNLLYEESFDGTYGGEYAHELLHTYYTDRKVDKTWGINFKSIRLNHTSVSSFYSQSVIKVENNFIKAPYNFIHILNREFLNLPKIKEQCSLLNSYKYQFMICKKDFNVNKFPKLEFYSDELNYTFILEGKDLFVYDKKNKNYIFLIIFDIHSKIQSGWQLGLPFLRKNQIFFDFSEESLGIVEPKKNIKKSSFSELFNVVVISFLIGIIFSYLFLLPKKKGRKTRLNELEEEMEGEYIEN
jgi:NADH-quinone oxidoreductase subunit G